MDACDPVSGLLLYPSVERKAPSDHPDLCKRRRDAAGRHGTVVQLPTTLYSIRH
jgi:hypothetical protein